MWGFENHLELEDAVFVAQPAGHRKRRGRVVVAVGVMVKEKTTQSQRGVSNKLRVLNVGTTEGTGCIPTGPEPPFRRTQAELLARGSHLQASCPLFGMWLLSPPHEIPNPRKSISEFQTKCSLVSLENVIPLVLNQADGNVCNPFTEFGK